MHLLPFRSVAGHTSTMPVDAAPPPCPDLAQHALRTQADLLRREADAIGAELRSLCSFDRPDVWQGARATAFRSGLDDQLRRLSAPGTGLCDALRDAAARMERRADELAAIPPAPAVTGPTLPGFCPAPVPPP